MLAQVSVVSGAGQISGEGLAPPEGVRGRFAVLVSCVKPDLHRLFWGLAPGSRLTGTGEPTVLRQPALGPANRKKNFFFFPNRKKHQQKSPETTQFAGGGLLIHEWGTRFVAVIVAAIGWAKSACIIIKTFKTFCV